MSAITPSLSLPTPYVPDDFGLSEPLLSGGQNLPRADGSAATHSIHGGDKPDPAAVGKAFEGIFAAILVKQMRQSLGTNLFGHDPGDVCGGLFDHFMSQHIAQHGGLGIGKLIEKNLLRRNEHHG